MKKTGMSKTGNDALIPLLKICNCYTSPLHFRALL